MSPRQSPRDASVRASTRPLPPVPAARRPLTAEAGQKQRRGKKEAARERELGHGEVVGYARAWRALGSPQKRGPSERRTRFWTGGFAGCAARTRESSGQGARWGECEKSARGRVGCLSAAIGGEGQLALCWAKRWSAASMAS